MRSGNFTGNEVKNDLNHNQPVSLGSACLAPPGQLFGVGTMPTGTRTT
jgi:hypothetical protein